MHANDVQSGSTKHYWHANHMFFQVEKDQENIQLFPAPVQNKSSLSLGKKRVWREGGGRRGEQLENGFLKVKLKICTTICWRTFFLEWLSSWKCQFWKTYYCQFLLKTKMAVVWYLLAKVPGIYCQAVTWTKVLEGFLHFVASGYLIMFQYVLPPPHLPSKTWEHPSSCTCFLWNWQHLSTSYLPAWGRKKKQKLACSFIFC